jgi:uncharacterized protein (DUF362 family)
VLGAPLAAGTKSKVVVAHGAGMNETALLRALDNAMRACFDVDTPVEAWRRVVKPGEVVGLKVNCLSGKGNSTHVVLVEALCHRLQEAEYPRRTSWYGTGSTRISKALGSGHQRIPTASVIWVTNAGLRERTRHARGSRQPAVPDAHRCLDAVINLPVSRTTASWA